MTVREHYGPTTKAEDERLLATGAFYCAQCLGPHGQVGVLRVSPCGCKWDVGGSPLVLCKEHA